MYTLLMEKPKIIRPRERQRRRWEDNIKMNLQELGRGDMDWIDLAQDRYGWRELVNGFHKCGEFLD